MIVLSHLDEHCVVSPWRTSRCLTLVNIVLSHLGEHCVVSPWWTSCCLNLMNIVLSHLDEHRVVTHWWTLCCFTLMNIVLSHLGEHCVVSPWWRLYYLTFTETIMLPYLGYPRTHLLVVGRLFFLFCSCGCFCLHGPFNCISFHKFSLQLSVFSFSSSCLISAIWSFQSYISFWKSPSALI